MPPDPPSSRASRAFAKCRGPALAASLQNSWRRLCYRKIFNEEFNLSFGYPRSDTCETCDLLHVTIQASKSEEERAELQVELAAHQEKASQGYRLLRTDAEATKTTGDHTLLIFDLMQNLPVPTLTHGSMFYSRQLWVYNFGIHNTTTGAASIYTSVVLVLCLKY